MFSFYTLGVMSGAAEEVATGAEVTKTDTKTDCPRSFLSTQACFVLQLALILNNYKY